MPIVNEAWLDRFGCISAEPVAERWEKERALTVSPSAALRAGMPPPASHPHGWHRVVSWVGRHASESGA